MGAVFFDRNHDSIPSIGEGLSGLTVSFRSLGRLASATTDSGGAYALSLVPGSYQVTFASLPDTISYDTLAPVSLVAGQTMTLNVPVLVVHDTDSLSVPASTLVLDSTAAAQVVVSDSGATLSVPSGGSGVAAMHAGDIIVIGVTATSPTGLLRRVASVSTSGGRTTLTTVPATIEEAVANGSFAVEKRLTQSDLVSFQAPAGVSLVRAPSQASGDLTVYINRVFWDQDGDSSTTNDQIRIDGSVTLSPTVILEGHISWFKIDDARAGARLEIQSDLSTTWSAVKDAKNEVQIARFVFTPVPFGPFVFVPTLTIFAGIQGSVSGAVGASLSYSADALAEVQFQDGSWKGVQSFDNEASGDLHASVTASAEAYVRAPIDFTLYGVVGPSVGIKTYVEGDVTPLADPWWQLYFGATAQAGFEMQVFSRYIAGVKLDLIDYRKVIAQASGPLPQTYTITVSASPTDGGSVAGAGTYDAGATVTLTAMPASGYAFRAWSEKGDPVSTSTSYQFVATSDRTLVAQFARSRLVVMSPTSITFEAFSHGPLPLHEGGTVTSATSSVLTGLHGAFSYGEGVAGFLGWNMSPGTETPTTFGMGILGTKVTQVPGTYTATVLMATDDSEDGIAEIPVTFVVSGATPPTPHAATLYQQTDSSETLTLAENSRVLIGTFTPATMNVIDGQTAITYSIRKTVASGYTCMGYEIGLSSGGTYATLFTNTSTPPTPTPGAFQTVTQPIGYHARLLPPGTLIQVWFSNGNNTGFGNCNLELKANSSGEFFGSVVIG